MLLFSVWPETPVLRNISPTPQKRWDKFEGKSQEVDQHLGHIALVTEQLAKDIPGHLREMPPIPVVHVSLVKVEREYLALVVDDQVQLEAKEPPYGALPSLGMAIEYPVAVYPAVAAHLEVRGVHEIDSPAPAQAAHLDEQHEHHGATRLQLHEPVVGDHPREQVLQVRGGAVHIERLQVVELPVMEQYHQRDHFALAESGGAVAHAQFPVFDHLFFQHRCYFFTKVIRFYENLYNFISQHGA